MSTPPEPAKHADGARPLLEVRNLHMQFPIKRGLLRRTVGFVHAVNDVSFSIRPGETLSLVGESGCGKTTTGRCIVRVYSPTAGQILYQWRSAKASTWRNSTTVNCGHFGARFA